jgi:hypothetical protein
VAWRTKLSGHMWTRGQRASRTRITSLGICAVRAGVRPDLQRGVFANDRERPLVTGVNGTTFSPDLRLEGSGLSSAAAVDPTALAARGEAVRIGSSWTNILGRASVDGTARW